MLFVISGPTGSGKDTVISELLKELDGSYKMPSTVTRTQRPGEEGYRYVSVADFEQLIKEDKLLEYGKVHGTDYYGTLKADIKDSIESNVPVFRILDVDGYQNIKKQNIKCVGIFLWVLDKDELARRIYLRGEDSEDIKRRIARVDYELEMSEHYDHIVNCGDLEKSVEECIQIVKNYMGKR